MENVSDFLIISQLHAFKERSNKITNSSSSKNPNKFLHLFDLFKNQSVGLAMYCIISKLVARQPGSTAMAVK